MPDAFRHVTTSIAAEATSYKKPEGAGQMRCAACP